MKSKNQYKPEYYLGNKIHFVTERIDLREFPQMRKNTYFESTNIKKKVTAYLNNEPIGQGRTKQEAFNQAKNVLRISI